MYGLVNRALEELVIERAGLATWSAVKQKAGVQVAAFESMEPYPDEVTYSLVAAASEILGEVQSELLRDFGKHWILFTARSTYGPVLAAAGRNHRDFIGNLDAMHATLASTIPGLVPPRFSVSDEADGSLRVRYESERPGLAPMVIGLLEGLGELFESELEVSHVLQRCDANSFDEFLVAEAKRDRLA